MIKDVKVVRVPIPPFWSGINASCAFDHLLPTSDDETEELKADPCPRPGYLAEQAVVLLDTIFNGAVLKYQQMKIQMIRASSFDKPGDPTSMLYLVGSGSADIISRYRSLTNDRISGPNISYAVMSNQDSLVYIYRTVEDSRPELASFALIYEPRAYWFLMIVLMLVQFGIRRLLRHHSAVVLTAARLTTVVMKESVLTHTAFVTNNQTNNRRRPSLLETAIIRIERLWMRKFYENFRIINGFIFTILLSALASYLFDVFTKERPKTEPFTRITDLRDRLADGSYRMVTTDEALYRGLIAPEPAFITTQIQREFADIKAADPESSVLKIGGWGGIAREYLLENEDRSQKWVMVGPHDLGVHLRSQLCGLTFILDENGFNFGTNAIYWNSMGFPWMPKLTRNQIVMFDVACHRLESKYFVPRRDCPLSPDELAAQAFNSNIIIKFSQIEGVFKALVGILVMSLGVCLVERLEFTRQKSKGADSATNNNRNLSESESMSTTKRRSSVYPMSLEDLEGPSASTAPVTDLRLPHVTFSNRRNSIFSNL